MVSISLLMRHCWPAWAIWPRLKCCSVRDQVCSSGWFNKADSPPPPQMDMALEHLACSQWLCSHDTVPCCSTCCSDLWQQMFQLHSIPKSMTIDLEEIPARIHHLVCFEFRNLLQFVLLLNWREADILFSQGGISYLYVISTLRKRMDGLRQTPRNMCI